MASPAVAATTEGALGSATTSLPITLPGSGSATDGYLIIVAKGATACTINALTDWAEALDENAATGLAVLWYTGTGVPSNPTFTQSANTRSAWAAYRITGTDRATTPTVGTTSTGSSTTPDPPSATVTGGPKDILAIACFSRGGEIADDDSIVASFPTNYTSGQVEKSAGTAGTNLAGIIGSAARQVSGASSEDPGTFTIVTGAWRAQTIIVYPAAPTTVNGNVAAEADSGITGKVLQVYTTTPAAEANTAISGTILETYTATPATEADTAPAGTVIQPQTVAGGVAHEADTTPAGQVWQTYTCTPATEVDTAPAGSVAQVYPSGSATESNTVPAGTVDQSSGGQTINGGVASSTETARAGTIAEIYAAATATQTDTAVSGTVLQAILVTAGIANETNTTPTGAAAVAAPYNRWPQTPALPWPRDPQLPWPPTTTTNWPTDPQNPWP